MNSDIIAIGTIAPPRRKAPTPLPATPLTDVRTHSAEELERDLTNMLRAARRTSALTELATDGSPKVASLVAVWLISQVGKLVGRPKLVNLSKVRRDDLRSVRGVARLVHRSLHVAPALKAS